MLGTLKKFSVLVLAHFLLTPFFDVPHSFTSELFVYCKIYVYLLKGLYYAPKRYFFQMGQENKLFLCLKSHKITGLMHECLKLDLGAIRL